MTKVSKNDDEDVIRRDNDEQTLKQVQSVVLNIANCFSSFCEEHNLRYYLGFGSLLGAVRHGGFVPWDDDMDFLMPREDYEIFLTLAENGLADWCDVRCFRHEGYNRCVTRVSDNRTALRLDSYLQGNELPIWIDVFALDGIPEGWFSRKAHGMRLLWRKALWAFSAFDEVVNQNRPGRPLYQRVVIEACKRLHFGRHLDSFERLKAYDSLLQVYRYDEFENVFCGTATYKLEKCVWPRKAYDSVREYPFEDAGFPGPVDFDSVLSITYGDYMTLPPENMRTIHHMDILKLPDHCKMSYADNVEGSA